MNKKVFVVLCFLCLIFVIFSGYKYFLNKELTKVSIGKNIILVKIADDAKERARGLSGVEFLPENQGELFVFNFPKLVSFWMKDMLIPLDIIWIYKNRIVRINENIKPEDYQPPKSLSSGREITEVVEVNAGTVNRLGLQVGDKFSY